MSLVLFACPRCHRQYDVAGLAPGALVRCLCGHVSPVPTARARQVEMQRCSNCGGTLAEGATDCAYCGARVKASDRGLGPTCPECLATTSAGAKHCGACGVRLAPEGVLRVLSSRACPRCRADLCEVEAAQTRFVECPRCAGLWLDEPLFERVTTDRDSPLAALRASGARASAAPPSNAESVLRYLPCPQCGEVMHRRNFAESSGVILDSCRGHGWWLDAHELERVLAFVERGGLERARAVQHERRREELRREPAAPLPELRGRSLLGELLEVFADFL